MKRKTIMAINTAKATTSYDGNTLTVTTGVTVSISKGKSLRDRKTGETVSYQGQVTNPKMKYQFMFLNKDSGEIVRHSAAYIAKYMA